MIDWSSRTREVAVEVGISPDLFWRQIRQESGFDPNAHNAGSGADGIAQIVPRWHPAMAGRTRDAEASLQYAARLMKSHLEANDSEWPLALSYYNAGPGATQRGLAGELPGWPYAETVNYVSAILDIPRATAIRYLTRGVPPTVLKLSDVLARGRSRIGDPYVWGGKVPPTTDCSGFIAWCYDGKVRSFTDHIYEDTERVDGKDVAPGDIVLYEYRDASQPGVRFPHGGLYLSDAETLDNRFGLGLGVHPQMSRQETVRYYRRLPGVLVDTLGGPVAPPVPVPAPPVPPVPPVPDAATLAAVKKIIDDALTGLYHAKSLLP